jgi:hypothetical protein
MKNLRNSFCLVFTLAICWTLCVKQAKAQNISEAAMDTLIDRKHDLTYKLQPLLIGEIRLSYEKVRAPKVSNEYGIGYIYKAYLDNGSMFPGFAEKNVGGFSIQMSQRHYTSKKYKAPRGFFHGPLLGYRFMVFEKDIFSSGEFGDPGNRVLGRLYQNSLDLSYQIGGQFLLGEHITLEIAGALGGRLKYANARNAGDLLENSIIGHPILTDRSSILLWVPVPQLKIAIGYSF